MKIKGLRLYLVIIIFIVLISVVGFTFSYLKSSVYSDGNSDVSFELSDKAYLKFEKGQDIDILAGVGNLGIDGEDISLPTTASVTLTAQSDYTAMYYVYFEILSNDFVYTTDDEIAELLLVIKRPDGSYVTEIDGLEYTTSGDIEGFDVTTSNGLYEVAVPTLITLDYTGGEESVTLDWEFILYFRNLETNQGDNASKTFESDVILTGEIYVPTKKLSDEILLNVTGESNVNSAKTVIEAKETPNFSVVSETNEGLFATVDDYGTSYYFRGGVDNNWVYFAGYYWRIVRIDGEGNVKLLNTGTVAPNSTSSVVLTGEDTNAIRDVYYNEECKESYCVGYMYTVDEWRGYSTDSTAKTVIDTWYEENMMDYSSFLADTIYCVDRSSYGDTAGTIENTGYVAGGWQIFGAAVRVVYKASPTLVCSNIDDSFTVYDTENGNGALEYPVGMLTMDEISFAGSKGSGTFAKNNYLYTNYHYWLMSPYLASYSSNCFVSSITSYGVVSGKNTWSDTTNIRPVVSIKADISVSKGDGTWDNPYIIE